METAKAVAAELKAAAERSNFVLSEKKTEGPAPAVTAFNVVLANHSLEISAARMAEFKAVLEKTTSERQREGILRYIGQVNAVQVEEVAG